MTLRQAQGRPNGRDRNGRFAEGNPGGPGRPRRATEHEYLAALSDACPPETWRAIVTRAVTDAEAGDAKAREWLAGYLIGRPQHDARTLQELAVAELNERDPVEAVARRQASADVLDDLMAGWPGR